MQPKFKASNNSKTLNAVVDLIESAKKDNAYIIVAQYMYFGKTHHIIKERVKNYKSHAYVDAPVCDKSKVIQTKLQYQKIRSSKFRVCGVNTDACVYRTIAGLNSRIKPAKIEVIEEACNTNSDELYKLLAIDKLKRIPNITVH